MSRVAKITRMDASPAPATAPATAPKGNIKVTREDWLELAGEVLIERGSAM